MVFKEQLGKGVVVSAVVIGASFGLASFWDTEKTRKATKNYNDRMAMEHPQYGEFLKEDSDRRFLSGDELVASYSDWLRGKS